jgi:hypothetical protein
MMEKEGESGCGAEQAGFRFALLGFRFLFSSRWREEKERGSVDFSIWLKKIKKQNCMREDRGEMMS